MCQKVGGGTQFQFKIHIIVALFHKFLRVVKWQVAQGETFVAESPQHYTLQWHTVVGHNAEIFGKKGVGIESRVDGEGVAGEFQTVDAVEAKLVNEDGKTKSTAVSGTKFTDAAGNNYTLDSEVVVYVYDVDDDKWSAGTKSSMAGKGFEGIFLYKTDASGDYDFVIVMK